MLNSRKGDLVLARYTCIALQRLGGSAKKVKGGSVTRYEIAIRRADMAVTLLLGSLSDKTMRLPMDSPIFVKLQDIIEFAPRSPKW